MDAVFQKTRELGQALIESEAYQQMKAAEDKAARNQEAADTMNHYLELRGQIQEILSRENPDSAVLKRLSDGRDAGKAQHDRRYRRHDAGARRFLRAHQPGQPGLAVHRHRPGARRERVFRQLRVVRRFLRRAELRALDTKAGDGDGGLADDAAIPPHQGAV